MAERESRVPGHAELVFCDQSIENTHTGQSCGHFVAARPAAVARCARFVRLTSYGGMRLALWLIWSLVAGALALGHLLFALGNFRFGGLAIFEGVAAALAGLVLIASIMIFRRSPIKAAVTILAGSLPLTAWFALATMLDLRVVDPAWPFLLLSLVVPSTAVIAILLIRFFGER